mgnify:CR=1 FL=1
MPNYVFFAISNHYWYLMATLTYIWPHYLSFFFKLFCDLIYTRLVNFFCTRAFLLFALQQYFVGQPKHYLDKHHHHHCEMAIVGKKKTQSGAYVCVCLCSSSWIQNLILHHHHVEWTRTHNVCPVLLVGWMNLTYNNNILGRITTTPTPYVFS